MTRPVGELQASFDMLVSIHPLNYSDMTQFRSLGDNLFVTSCAWAWEKTHLKLPCDAIYDRLHFQSEHIVHFIAFMLHWSGDHFYLPVWLSRKFNCEYWPNWKTFEKRQNALSNIPPNVAAQHQLWHVCRTLKSKDISVFKFIGEFLQFES